MDGESAWLEAMLDRPPDSLSALERAVGSLGVDFAGGEGFGRVQRSAGLRAGVESIVASFWFDVHHEDPYRPRDMRLRDVELTLAVPVDELQRRLALRFGAGRPVIRGGAAVQEYGAWFYVAATGRSPSLLYATERPAWALPAVQPPARAQLLATLLERLIGDTTEAPIVAALVPLMAAAGAELVHPFRYASTTGHGGIAIRLRPGLATATVCAALGWDAPVGYAADVHMSAWYMVPRAALESGAPWRARVGTWAVEAQLDGWPRGPGGAELPRVEPSAPLTRYDLATCATTVVSLEITTAA